LIKPLGVADYRLYNSDSLILATETDMAKKAKKAKKTRKKK
jgi:hypothetical protein